jgi:membrane-associated phospholipid phosphatase
MLSESPTFIVTALFTTAITILLLDIDTQVFLLTNKIGAAFVNQMWMIITVFGNRLFALLLLFILFWRHLDLLKAALIAALISFLIVISMKSLIAFARPYDVLDPASFYFIGVKAVTYAFPSGHTAAAFAILGSLGFYFKSNALIVFLFFFASLIGISRIMLGLHWPIDILVGAALGWICAWLSFSIIQADFFRNSNVWNYVTYLLYLLMAGYLFWVGSEYRAAFWLVEIVSLIALFVAIKALIWLLRGGNKKPISVSGWLTKL